ncbi:MAG: hypothetical protein JSW38_05340 [Dehalococcoidia bacterium]|nr:MAG: hypothetical protein JSW38_05340 [Dehalococcoidia bacterium]
MAIEMGGKPERDLFPDTNTILGDMVVARDKIVIQTNVYNTYWNGTVNLLFSVGGIGHESIGGLWFSQKG